MLLTRRQFVVAGAAGVFSLSAPLRLRRVAGTADHPAPRRGITGAKVLSAAQLAKHPKLVSLFDSVRKLPHIMDGIRCNCGCGNPPSMYSLLSCYEVASPMALDCAVCQGQARLAARLHGEGSSLEQIRKAVDAKFG
ncbi:MAG: hypothetical protein H7Z40_22225 [Phycisphaerae bacterium]|nr:hypothetical protein [Gemmatimonadaceae bacterium]